MTTVPAGCRRLLPTLALAAAGALAASCGTAPVDRYYRFDSTPAPVRPGPAAPDAAAPGSADIGPGAVQEIRVVIAGIPESVDRPQLVVQRGPNELQVLESARWAEPVRGGIARTLAQDLASAFPDAWIVTEGHSGGDAAITVTVSIDAMEASADETRLEARWRVGSTAAPARVSQRLALRRAANGTVPAAAVAAWSAELAEIAQAIARSVREISAHPQ